MTAEPVSGPARGGPTAERRAAEARLRGLLRERTRVLSLFSRLAAMRPFKRGPVLRRALREFCQALVDYAASGHFLIYRFLAEGTERRVELEARGRALYPRILSTTEQIVRFNDAYAEGSGAELAHLPDELADLGEALAERIVLEDRLIDAGLGQR